MSTAPTSPNIGTPPPPGRIDIHSHLLPGVDDGCQDVDESLECIHRLIKLGYVGTVCTPHIWHEAYAINNAVNVREWTRTMQQTLDNEGIPYRVWPGGELRLFEKFIDYYKDREIPTLAGGRCVLVDFWADRWPKWVNPIFQWLRTRGYQPILAHPERLKCTKELDERMREMATIGVWLQGNFQCMTGQEGFHADLFIRQWSKQRRYNLMSLDMHRPESLDARLDGVQLFEQEFGAEMLDLMTITAPRRLILGLPS
ncbi:MAG: hypothetical protein K8S99_01785 [Planctomycetes bacterium]|nr:hypothetical protein [Planctomycetota bacterium]